MKRLAPCTKRPKGSGTRRRPWSVALVLAVLLLLPALPVGAQGTPLLTGGGGPTMELFLLDPGELGAADLPEMMVLQGGGGFGRYQAWRVGGYGAAGQTAPNKAGESFSLTYGGIHAAYLPGAQGAFPTASPRTSLGALFGLGMATLQRATDSERQAFLLFRPEAAIEFGLGQLGTVQVGVTYTFPIPMGTSSSLGDLRGIQRPAFRLGLVFGGF